MESPLAMQVARNWWIVALRGAIAVIIGVLAFIVPGATLYALILLFGAYMFIDGIAAVAAAIQFRHERERWPMLLLEGILGIGVGLVSFFWPGFTALVWLYTIAAWAFITGILEIATAIRLRRMMKNEAFLILSGILSIALAIAFVVYPRAGLIAWIWIIGWYAILFGALLLAFAFRLRRLATPGTRGPTVRPAGV